MTKRILLSIVFILNISFYVSAQLSAVDYTSEDYAQFKGSKTYIVRTGHEKFDSEVAAAMKELWTITPTEPIDLESFKTKVKDKSASFVFLVTIGTGNRNQNYHYFALANGGKKNINAYGYDDMLAYCPINHFQNEKENVDCYYRVRNMVESMVQAMDIVQKNNIKGNSLKIVNGLMEYYRTKSPKIKERTLLFCSETLGEKINKSDIAGLYPFKFEICDKAKIEQVIKDKSTEYYYYQPTITLNKCMFVFDPSNGEVLFGSYQVMGLSINKGNLEDLAKAVKGGK